ncbi:NAD(P)-binding protein [Aaosphaeria arxii CBS 175.79]|uniref:NAD(P)-binding protein n=1 Tax=Aaosphaeria arxii CBS 175.79 TaxID=1450172 RepID=A0A6A5XFJ1_9PLEO|nr:NAD(P)-binding protein [Aaosphaeria arxii CBS 175.79]KAF2011852.1 NAD(P)-binding protein [Aaosphaeria arxii CBS 175.79]
MATERVLLTGADSLIGSHVLNQLLFLLPSVSVRAVVGSREQARMLAQRFPQASNRLDFTVIPQQHTSVPGAYDEALSDYSQPFDTVIHTAIPEPFEQADCLSRFIHLQTVDLINFVRNVKDAAPAVRRVVIVTSFSSFARWLVDPGMEDDHLARRDSSTSATKIDTDYILVTSQSSSSLVHEALLRWLNGSPSYSSPGRQFDLVSVTSPSIYGPSLCPLENSSDLEEANRRIWNICSNDARERTSSPPYGIDFYSDVRDLALASVRATSRPQAGGKRFVVSAGRMPSGPSIATLLKSRFPELGRRIRPEASSESQDPQMDSSMDVIDNHLAASMLGMTHHQSVEETLVDTAHQILELQQRKEWKRVIQS